MDDWNRNDEWEVKRTFHELATLVVTIASEKKAEQIAALRRIIPSLRDNPLTELLTQISNEGRFDLGEMSGRDARHLEEELRKAGMETSRVDTSVVSFLPINKTNGFAWLIEDSVEAERIARQMISEGAEVTEVEA